MSPGLPKKVSMQIQSWRFLFSASQTDPLPRPTQQRTGLSRLRALISLAVFTVITCAAALAQAHEYSTIVVFGDSLSDTGNELHLSLDKYGVPVPGYIPLLENYT